MFGFFPYVVGTFERRATVGLVLTNETESNNQSTVASWIDGESSNGTIVCLNGFLISSSSVYKDKINLAAHFTQNRSTSVDIISANDRNAQSRTSALCHVRKVADFQTHLRLQKVKEQQKIVPNKLALLFSAVKGQNQKCQNQKYLEFASKYFLTDLFNYNFATLIRPNCYLVAFIDFAFDDFHRQRI
jgi:hypothetical protein